MTRIYPGTWGAIVREFGGSTCMSQAQACWEALIARGILHDSLLHDQQRMFRIEPKNWKKDTWMLSLYKFHPITVGACVVVASAVTSLLRIEQMIRSRLEPTRVVEWVSWSRRYFRSEDRNARLYFPPLPAQIARLLAHPASVAA